MSVGVPRAGPPREDLRKLVHVFYGLFAVLLAYLPPAGAVALAGLGVLHNRFLLPAYAGPLLRPTDTWPGGGIHLYPIAVLGLVLVFLRRPELAAAGWGVLAFGDGFAALVGRNLRGPRLPWNPKKTVVGSIAYVGFGTLGAAALLSFVSGHAGPNAALGLRAALVPAGLAALACAIVESLPLALDDNATAPFAALAVLGAWAACDPAVLAARGPELGARLLPAFGVSTGLAVLVFRTGAVTVSGAVGGLALAAGTWIFGGWRSFALFVLFFVLAQAATRSGRAVKAARGVAQERGGRRSFRNAFANTAVAVGAAFLAAAVREPAPYILGVAGAFAAATLDTLSSEVGQVRGHRPVLITTLRPVPIGTEGAVSREGTVAGLVGAAAIAGAGAALGMFGWVWTPVVVVAAWTAGTAESVAGALLGRRGLIGNETMNLLNTAVGASLCVAAGLMARP